MRIDFMSGLKPMLLQCEKVHLGEKLLMRCDVQRIDFAPYVKQPAGMRPDTSLAHFITACAMYVR